MILYYKIACCYFGAGQPDKALDFLNNIINGSSRALREDILLYARLLAILCYYETDNDAALDYFINTIDRHLSILKFPDQLGVAFITFFKKLTRTLHSQKSILFSEFSQELNNLKNSKVERRAFIFLDLPEWVRSKLV